CQAVFEAAGPAARPPDPPESPAPAGTPGLKGAVEIKLSLDDQPPAPARAPAPPPERQERPPPRLADDHDDLLECPACGRSNHRDSRRCYHCAERLDGRSEQDEGRRRAPPRR